MKDKVGGALFCLLFAVVFGGIGVFATWTIATTLYDGMRARDWVRVKAHVDFIDGTDVRYRYTFQGREYSGGRVGSSPVGGGDDIDDWSANMQDYLAAAHAERHPITVLVDPEKPSNAMVDGEIRWKFLAGMLPFSIVFGGVGLGALYGLYRVLRGKRADRAPALPRRSAASDARNALLGLWFFAIFSNAIAFPIAFLAVPPMIEQGNWVGVLVLLLPLFGLFAAWGAIRGTWTYLRRGGAKLKLRGDSPRIGSSLEGTAELARGDALDDARSADPRP